MSLRKFIIAIWLLCKSTAAEPTSARPDAKKLSSLLADADLVLLLVYLLTQKIREGEIASEDLVFVLGILHEPATLIEECRWKMSPELSDSQAPKPLTRPTSVWRV